MKAILAFLVILHCVYWNVDASKGSLRHEIQQNLETLGCVGGQYCGAFSTCGTCGSSWFCGADLKCQAKKTRGSNCLSNVECASGLTCFLTKCLSSPLNPGEPCVAGSGLSCNSDSFCDGSRCVSKKSRGEACLGTADCKSGLTCFLNKCLGSPRLEWERCDVLNPCASGLKCNSDLYCQKVLGTSGQRCDVLNKCESGLICGLDAKCWHQPGWVGERCDAANLCDPQKAFCSGVFMCEAKRTKYSACSVNDHCLPGLECFLAKCQSNPRSLGDPCALGGTPCAQGLFCDGATCKAKQDRGAICSVNTQCKDYLVCDRAMCVLPNARYKGEPCLGGLNGQCWSTEGRDMVCAPSGICENILRNGEGVCLFAAQDEKRYNCFGSKSCGIDSKCWNFPRLVGDPCGRTANEMCEVSLTRVLACSPVDGKCYKRPGLGETCIRGITNPITRVFQFERLLCSPNNLYCSSSQGKCFQKIAADSPCFEPDSCVDNYQCQNGKCTYVAGIFKPFN